MTRGLALLSSFLLAATVPALAQSHPPSHDRGYPHDHSAHAPLDSAQHAAMHAMLIGSWKGTFSYPQGATAGMQLSVIDDSHHKVALRMNTDRSMRAGVATNVEVNAGELRWTQELSGNSCKATALLTPSTTHARKAMNGRMVCADRELTFTLEKQAE
jgi:hypothetical protein